MNDAINPNQPSAWSGLLETFKSPLGQGLLSAAAIGLAGAKRGQPWNNFGRALQGGLLGYGDAVDQQSRDQVRAFQLDQMKRQKELAELGDQFYQTPQQVALGTGAAQGSRVQGGFDGQGNYVPTSSPVGPTVGNANAHEPSQRNQLGVDLLLIQLRADGFDLLHDERRSNAPASGANQLPAGLPIQAALDGGFNQALVGAARPHRTEARLVVGLQTHDTQREQDLRPRHAVPPILRSRTAAARRSWQT